MTTLQEAWAWYEATRESLQLIARLAEKHWNILPWEGAIGQDAKLRDKDGPEVLRQSHISQLPLDDFAVLALFSVFESIIRDEVHDQVANEISNLRHPTLIHAGNEALGAIEDGSFFRVLEPYKSRDSGLIEEVNQVQQYRNWVAHGRRGDPPGKPPIRIDPRTAYDRLRRLLEIVQPSVTTSP